jgi:hypothetical protein
VIAPIDFPLKVFVAISRRQVDVAWVDMADDEIDLPALRLLAQAVLIQLYLFLGPKSPLSADSQATLAAMDASSLP